MTKKAVNRSIELNNFRIAREMLCIKMGWEREHQHYIRRHDADANSETVKAFKSKVTRLLAYNYDVHRCPNPSLFPRLLPTQHPQSQPVRFPPEWNEKYNKSNSTEEL